MTQALPRSLLVVSSGAGSVTPEVREKLARAFARLPAVEFDPKADFRKLVAPGGRIVAAGGDGTIGTVVRSLAGSDVALGVLSLGTFNNFARALELPEDIDGAIAAVKAGRPRPVTLGSVNGQVFLEAAAIGFFGGAIAVGEAAKERELGALGRAIRAVAGARPFEFQLRGDLNGAGAALSLVFANTPSIGARLQVAQTGPRRPFLELSVRVGITRHDVVGRAVAAALNRDAGPPNVTFRFTRLEVETKPRVAVYADNKKVGRTPTVIAAQPRALRVLLPPGKAGDGRGE